MSGADFVIVGGLLLGIFAGLVSLFLRLGERLDAAKHLAHVKPTMKPTSRQQEMWLEEIAYQAGRKTREPTERSSLGAYAMQFHSALAESENPRTGIEARRLTTPAKEIAYPEPAARSRRRFQVPEGEGTDWYTRP